MPQTQLISFLVNRPQFALRLLSQHYPFTLEQLERYSKALVWEIVSKNENIRWSYPILWQFAEQLDWKCVSMNPSAFKDLSLLKEFDAFIDWQGDEDSYGDSIASNTGLPWTEYFISSLEHKISFEKLSANESVRWSEALVDRYKGRWDSLDLGSNESVPWTLPLFERHLHESDFYFFGVTANPALIRNVDLVEKYSHRMEWWAVFANSQLPWGEKHLLQRWRKHISWYGLSMNEFFFGIDCNFFRNHIDRWMENSNQGFIGLSSNRQMPWSQGLIDEYLTLWRWPSLCANNSVPWNDEMIEYFGDRVEWGGAKPSGIYNEDGEMIAPAGGKMFEIGLTGNKNLPWSVDFLTRHQSQFDIDDLSCHPHIWDKAFMPYIDDDMVDKVLRII